MITNNFPGGLLMNVRRLYVEDCFHSFEDYCFTRMSLSFPLLPSWRISNQHQQKKKFVHERDQTSLIIKYFHLVELSFNFVEVDYVK